MDCIFCPNYGGCGSQERDPMKIHCPQIYDSRTGAISELFERRLI